MGHADPRVNIRNSDQKPATSHPCISIKQEEKGGAANLPKFVFRLQIGTRLTCISMTSCCRAQNFVRLFQLNLIPVARSGGSFSHYQESRRARCALFPVLPRKAAVLYNLYEQKRQCMSSGSDMIKVGFE